MLIVLSALAALVIALSALVALVIALSALAALVIALSALAALVIALSALAALDNRRYCYTIANQLSSSIGLLKMHRPNTYSYLAAKPCSKYNHN